MSNFELLCFFLPVLWGRKSRDNNVSINFHVNGSVCNVNEYIGEVVKWQAFQKRMESGPQ